MKHVTPKTPAQDVRRIETPPLLLWTRHGCDVVPSGTPFFVRPNGELHHPVNAVLLDVARKTAAGILSLATLRTYANDAAAILKEMAVRGYDITTLRPKVVPEIVGLVREDGRLSASTIGRRLSMLARLVEEAVRHGLPIDRDLVRQCELLQARQGRAAIRIASREGLEELIERRAPTKEEFEAFCAHLPERTARLMAKLAFATGLRPFEARELRLAQLENAKRGADAVELQILGKGRKRRTVKVDPDLVRELEEYVRYERTSLLALDEAGEAIERDALFINSKTGLAFQTHEIHYLFAKASEESGHYIRPHDLRRAYATAWVEDRYAEDRPWNEALKLQLGHSDWRTTRDSYVVLDRKAAPSGWTTEDLDD